MMIQGALSTTQPHNNDDEEDGEDGEEGQRGMHLSAVPWLVGRTTEGAFVVLFRTVRGAPPAHAGVADRCIVMT